MALLQIRDLEVTFRTRDGPAHAVNGLDLDLDSGEVLAVVGESGSGKSQTALAIMGLLAANGRATGSVRFRNQDILGLPDASMCRVRGSGIAMVFQDPMTSLNPYLRISTQMLEPLQLHQGLSAREARRRCIEMLEAVGIPDPADRFGMFPHEFSGGMRQRVMIATALLCHPRLLIADEPTTALDVTVQAQIMELLKSVRERSGTAIMLITHDLGVVAGISDRTLVMYGGQMMEHGPTEAVFATPSHPYTAALLETVPRLDRGEQALRPIPGEPPDVRNLPAGCPFAPRCAGVLEPCAVRRPPLFDLGEQRSACFRHEGPAAS